MSVSTTFVDSDDLADLSTLFQAGVMVRAQLHDSGYSAYDTRIHARIGQAFLELGFEAFPVELFDCAPFLV